MKSKNQIKRRKKLIEFSIPLEQINDASQSEKQPFTRKHPRSIHIWWARRPHAAVRAVIFCQLVDDPSAIPEEFSSLDAQYKERQRLFNIVCQIVRWENTSKNPYFEEANREIQKSWERCCKDNKNHPRASDLFNPENIPAFHDPFSGGGALPLEAQRLGLRSFASDLNPVAILLNKAMIEFPHKFRGKYPVNKNSIKQNYIFNKESESINGMISDLRFYGEWMRDKAKSLTKQYYPDIQITAEMVRERPDLEKYQNQSLKVISWLWARTVNSPDPAFQSIKVPLATTFFLSKKKGKERYIEPVINGNNYYFRVSVGIPKDKEKTSLGTSAGKRSGFKCLLSGSPLPYDYLRDEGKGGRMGIKLMAIVAEGNRERIYLSPNKIHEEIAEKVPNSWMPENELPNNPRDFKTPNYGLYKFGDLFTSRQLFILTTLSNLITDVYSKIIEDAKYLNDESKNIQKYEIEDYAKSLCTYLAMSVSKWTDLSNNVCSWNNTNQNISHLFARQAIPMNWDFAELSPFSNVGPWFSTVESILKAMENLSPKNYGCSFFSDAADFTVNLEPYICSTDPPYYDNIGYADLSDFFYVWLRYSLKDFFPELFKTLSVPKSQELVAAPYRHGGKDNAEKFFLEGMKKAMTRLSKTSHPAFPITIYYAFKQSETKTEFGTSSTGWETFLQAVLNSGLSISGTWPIRTEREARSIGIGKNALASSVVLVCCPRRQDAEKITRKEFQRELKQKLPNFLHKMEKLNTAPVDIAQASIGPGMEIFSQAESVLNPNDSKMTVREALVEINSALDEYLSKDDSEMDIDTLFAITFFESFSYSVRPFGDAEGLAKARNVSVEGIVKAGILNSFSGKVNLIKREDLPSNWNPLKDDRLCVWEATQYLIRTLEMNGEDEAAKLLNTFKNISGFGNLAASCRSLAYRLYNHCEKTNQSEEARSYNGLIISWPEIERISAEKEIKSTIQTKLI